MIASSREVRRADLHATVSLGKNVASAIGLRAAKSSNRDAHLNGATVRGQVQEPSLIAAVHLLGLPPAIRTRASGGTTPGGDEDAIWSDLNVIDQQTGWRQRSIARIHHGKHSPHFNAYQIWRTCIESESEPRLDADPGSRFLAV